MDLPPRPKSIAERFWPKVEVRDADDCWLWKGYKDPNGYGRMSGHRSNGRVLLAHRASYELTHGSIPDDLCVLHRCDNPPCVNPAHLWLGTKAENNRDMGDKGRAVVPALKGEAHPNSRLTTSLASELLKLTKEGWGQTDIARAFGVSSRIVWTIANGESWKHLHKTSERIDGLSV